MDLWAVPIYTSRMTASKAHVLKHTVVDSEVTSHRDHSDPLRSITDAMAAQLMSTSQRPRRQNYGCRAVQFLEAPSEKVDPRPDINPFTLQ